jgi:hypothetical protein
MENIKQSSKRSRAYPVIALGDALEKVEKIFKNLGLVGSYNRETLATSMEYASLNGSSARVVAALVHFGLLDREGDKYSLSELSKKYVVPKDDKSVIEAKQEAALYPSLFKELYDKYKDQVIPKQFANILVHDFKIMSNASRDVERIFRNTMETAELLNSQGVLKPESTTSEESLSQPLAETPEVPSNRPLDNTVNTANLSHLSVELPSGLIISYPQNLASAFAFGQFGESLKTLDEEVSTYNLKNNTSDNEEDITM